ncbi:Lactonase family protein [Mycena venus]|uniref:Lactonase family protein n=1 Tax=Mycena venus TaxID=2733690 RepID=A0A8H6XB48_9AGAR|nr:Lactonase family protein [Mycena venus]
MLHWSLLSVLSFLSSQTLGAIHTLIISGDSSGGAISTTFDDANHDFKVTGNSFINGADWITLVGTKRAYLTFRNTSLVAAYDVSPSGGLTLAGSPVSVPVPVYVGVTHNSSFLFTASYPTGAIATVPLSADGLPIPPCDDHNFRRSRPSSFTPRPSQATLRNRRCHWPLLDLPGRRARFAARLQNRRYIRHLPLRPTLPQPPLWPPAMPSCPATRVETWIMHYTPNNVSLILQGSAVSTLKVPAVGINVSTAAELLISPNGKYLLASNRDAVPLGDGSIAVFRINPPTAESALTRISITSSGGANPRSMSLDKTGKWLVVVNGNSNSTAMFAFNQETGILASTPVANLTGITVPQTVVWLENRETPTATLAEILRLQSEL